MIGRYFSDTWAEVLGYPCKSRKCKYRTTVYYDIKTKHLGRIHLYWYSICADKKSLIGCDPMLLMINIV